MNLKIFATVHKGAQWLSGRVLDSRRRDRGFKPHQRHCVVPGPWARHIYPSLVLVQPRKIRPCLTERLLMGRQESNQTKQQLIASWLTLIWLTAAKLTCPCNTLGTLNSITRSETGVVIDSEPHLSRMCKTSLLFAPLAICVYTACSAFPFDTPTKPLIQLRIKYKTVFS